jgi:hypothetical protein
MIKWDNGEILIEKNTYKTVNICDDLCIYYQLKNGIIIAVLVVDSKLKDAYNGSSWLHRFISWMNIVNNDLQI